MKSSRWRIKNKLLRALMAFLLCAALLFPITAGATNQAVLDASKSVVRIYAESGYSRYASIGSGFAVGTVGNAVEYIVTNYHVVADEDDRGDGIYDSIYVVLDNIYNSGSVRPAEMVCYNKNADYCILRIAPTHERVPIRLMSASTVERTQEVYALGFPSVADALNDDGENLPSTIEDVTITRGVISKTNSKSNDYYFLQMDTVINSGNSGGPLVTEDGYCVGINTFGATSGSTTNGAMFVDYVIQAMKDRRIAYTFVGEAPDITAAPGDVDNPDATPSPEPVIEQEPSDMILMLIGLAVVLGVLGAVVLIVVLIIGKRKKKKAVNFQQAGLSAPVQYAPVKPALQPDAKTRVIPAASSGGFSLVGVTGIYSGSVFPVNGEIVIGRDVASCNIVYPESAPGISSRHCRIIPGKDALVIEDLTSTYGTFLKDGNRTRLEPGKRKALPDGAGFFLAVEDNSFIVKRQQ